MQAALLLATWAFTNPIHPGVRAAFERQDVQSRGSITHVQTRRALQEIGADVSTNTARDLVMCYGHPVHGEGGGALARRLDVAGLDRIVRTDPAARPAQFWLVVDRHGTGVRKHRVGWTRFVNAGTRTHVRLVHLLCGTASVVVGAVDFVDYVGHAGLLALPPDTVILHAAVHTAAAVFSLPRFSYEWTPGKPHYLWMPNAREANMWPSAIVCAWYAAALASDFVRPPAEAFLSATHPAFVASTLVTVALSLYSASRTVLESEADNSGVYESTWANAVQVAAVMTVPILADTLKCLLVTHDPNVHAAYTSLVAAYPAYTQVYDGVMLAGLWLGSVACALSSAEHYGAVTKRDIGHGMHALTLVANAASLMGFVSIDNGQLAVSMVDVVLSGLAGSTG